MYRILALFVLLGISGAHAQEQLRVSFNIQGNCKDCSHGAIESVIWSIEGINSISYVGGGSMVNVIFNPKSITKEALLKEIRDAGYRVNGQGTGCCALAEQGTVQKVDVSWEEDDDDDPVLNDKEALDEIGKVQEEFKNVSIEEAVRSEASKDIDDSESSFHKDAEEVARLAAEIDQEEEDELDAEISAELSRVNND